MTQKEALARTELVIGQPYRYEGPLWFSDNIYKPTSADCILWMESYINAGGRWHLVEVDSSAKGAQLESGYGVM